MARIWGARSVHSPYRRPSYTTTGDEDRRSRLVAARNARAFPCFAELATSVAPAPDPSTAYSPRNGRMAFATASGNSSWIESLPFASRLTWTWGISASASISARDFGGV